ncbi:MAG: hypothetical protein E7255_02250 [Lachnospiraceae bacterium]|jgi:hypothetical protein|nr:hypothetical protein [Lachnospiraceae bacterium]
MDNKENDYIIYDLSDFASYLSEELSGDYDPIFLEELIRDYFYPPAGQHTKNGLAVLLDPHKPTQKEYERFWKN